MLKQWHNFDAWKAKRMRLSLPFLTRVSDTCHGTRLNQPISGLATAHAQKRVISKCLSHKPISRFGWKLNPSVFSCTKIVRVKILHVQASSAFSPTRILCSGDANSPFQPKKEALTFGSAMPLKALPPRNRRLHFQCEKIYSLELRFSIENQTELSQQGPVLDSCRVFG